MTVEWTSARQYEDILYETYNGIAKITINRPEVHNAFRTKTVMELIDAFAYAREDASIGVIVLAGAGDKAFCSGYLARIVCHKKAREILFLCRQYNAQEALDMGLVNTVVPLEQLEAETIQWCEEMLEKSPTALRFLKAAFNADTDGLAGIQQFAGDATLLYYTTDEAKEGRDAFKEKRNPDFQQFPRFP